MSRATSCYSQPIVAAERVLIVGGPGSGKTTLANRIGAATRTPVHHLDDVARVGGGTGAVRGAEERQRDIDVIVASPSWIAEGVHLGWTEPLFESADVIVWLDHVPWKSSGRRMVSRFVSQALREARQRRGRERFLRFGDYARRLRDLAVSIPEARGYERGDAAGADTVSRAATQRALLGREPKLIHCVTAADVEAAFRELTAPA
jgi:energy-coupling factor transporter ATP-binding protein EcfA2